MIIITVFSLCLVVQAGYLAVLAAGFRRAQRSASAAGGTERPAISVIVAARNEAEQLPALLDSLAEQDYPAFEVVVVDDGSTDATPEIVHARSVTDPRVRLVTVKPSEPRKKNALAKGVQMAKHGWLAFTDADCVPPPGWLSSIAARAAPGDVIVVGYSPFLPEPSVISRATRYETFATGFLTAAGIGLGRPYMAVGRNLSYSRATFETIGGFAHSRQSLSGDDDLLVQEASRLGIPSVHMFGSATHVETRGPARWSEWLRQKRRHASAGRFYRRSVQIHLAAYHASGHALWLAPLLAGLPGLALLAARLLMLWLALARPARVFGERDLLAALPVWELIYALYTASIAPAGVLFGPREWKTGSER